MTSMIDPFMLATDGVGPGFSTFNLATVGYGFEIEVIIQPKLPGGGGGSPITVDWFGRPLQGQYEIIIRIRYKGKEWEEKKEITEDIALSLVKVLVWVKGFSIKRAAVSIKNLVINKITPVIRIFKKGDSE